MPATMGNATNSNNAHLPRCRVRALNTGYPVRTNNTPTRSMRQRSAADRSHRQNSPDALSQKSSRRHPPCRHPWNRRPRWHAKSPNYRKRNKSARAGRQPTNVSIVLGTELNRFCRTQRTSTLLRGRRDHIFPAGLHAGRWHRNTLEMRSVVMATSPSLALARGMERRCVTGSTNDNRGSGDCTSS